MLVDGGWEEVGETTRLSAPELIAAMADPPEVLASMETYLADRREFDPASWDADQERAARAAVVERHAGHVSPVVRASVTRRLVDTLYAYQPLDALGRLPQPVIVLVAGTGTADDEERRERLLAVEDVQGARRAAGSDPLTRASPRWRRARAHALPARRGRRRDRRARRRAPWAEARASGTM